MRVDFTDVEDNEFKNIIVPKNQIVRVKVEKVEQLVSQAGNDYMKIRLNVVSPEEYEDACFFENHTFMKKTRWALKQILECFGIDTTGEVDFQPSDLEDREGDVKAGEGSYKGKPKNVVAKFIKSDEGDDMPF